MLQGFAKHHNFSDKFNEFNIVLQQMLYLIYHSSIKYDLCLWEISPSFVESTSCHVDSIAILL